MTTHGNGRVFLVMNPASRGGKSRFLFERIRSRFARRNVAVAEATTESFTSATRLARKACLDGFDTIVAVGGDGTINRVLNGFYSSEGRLISNARLGVIHTGTSPDLCKSYHIPVEVDAACETICSGGTRRIRTGMISYRKTENADSAAGVSFFACCADIGLGARLATLANSGIRRRFGDAAGTFLALLRVLATYRPVTVEMDMDGNRTLLERACNISVGRTFHVASGIKIANDLTDDDIRMYSLAAVNIGLRTLPGCLRALYSGKPFRNSSIFRFGYGNTFHLSSPDATVAVEFDGDAAGFLPCTIATAPDRLPLLCGDAHAC